MLKVRRWLDRDQFIELEFGEDDCGFGSLAVGELHGSTEVGDRIHADWNEIVMVLKGFMRDVESYQEMWRSSAKEPETE